MATKGISFTAAEARTIDKAYSELWHKTRDYNRMDDELEAAYKYERKARDGDAHSTRRLLVDGAANYTKTEAAGLYYISSGIRMAAMIGAVLRDLNSRWWNDWNTNHAQPAMEAYMAAQSRWFDTF